MAQLKYGMRAPSATELAALIPRVMDCFKAAALATGTTFTTHRQQVYLDLQPIQGLADEFKRYTEDRWQKENYQVTETPRSSASTDFVRDFSVQIRRKIDEVDLSDLSYPGRATSRTACQHFIRASGCRKQAATSFHVSEDLSDARMHADFVNALPRFGLVP